MNTTFKLLFVPVAIASVIAVKQVQYCFTDAHTIIKYLDYDQKEMRDANAYEEKQAPYFQIAGEIITAQTGSIGNFSYLGGKYCSHIDLPDNKILAFDEHYNVWLNDREGEEKLHHGRKGTSYLPALTKLADGRILITGGYKTFLEGATDDIEIYDPKTDEFKLVGKLLTPRANHGCIQIGKKYAYIACGEHKANGSGFVKEVGDAELLELDTFKSKPWTSTRPCAGHVMIRYRLNQVMIVGGNFTEGYPGDQRKHRDYVTVTFPAKYTSWD